MSMKKGDKVICVDDSGKPESLPFFQQWVEYGAEYTIRDIFQTSPRKGKACLLEEIENSPIFIPYLGREEEPSFGLWRFEKVVGVVNKKEDRLEKII